MRHGNINSDGSLPNKLLPVVYFDSCVLIDYFIAARRSAVETNDADSSQQDLLKDDFKCVRELLKQQSKLEAVLRIRDKLIDNKARKIAVISPLCILELVETHAEEILRENIASATSAKGVQKIGKKQIGQLLKNLMESLTDASTSNSLKRLVSATALDINLQRCRGLYGLYIANISSFNLTFDMVNQGLAGLSYLQIGSADIMHVLFAHHLGCAYFASWDEDFKRATNFLNNKYGIQLLSSAEQILDVL